MLNLTKKGNSRYIIKHNNELVIGEFNLDVDGRYYFWPTQVGHWTSENMLDLATLLNLVNKLEENRNEC
jgi:hypothetical protein